MSICLVGGQKGGVGKSTITVNIATELALRGQKVVIIDCDPQASATVWQKLREEHDVLPHISVLGLRNKIHTALVELAFVYDHVIVDIGARDTVEFRSGLICADKAILVNRSSQFDLDTYPFTLSIAQDTKAAFNPDLQVYALTSQVSTHARSHEIEDAREFYSQFEGATILDTAICYRVGYRRSIRDGRAVMEDVKGAGKGALEIRALVDELFPEVAGLPHKPGIRTAGGA